MLQVLAIGTEVELRGGVIGWINAICVRGFKASVSYEVRWWDHNDLKEGWFDEHEIKGKAESRPIKMGFDL